MAEQVQEEAAKPGGGFRRHAFARVRTPFGFWMRTANRSAAESSATTSEDLAARSARSQAFLER